MREHIVRIIGIDQVTHDVRQFRVEKPDGYTFVPGQATSVSINRPELKKKRRPFTFTGLNSDPFLEFIIKIYPSNQGVTAELEELKPGDELIIGNGWGAISYKGPGVFIAGGAGITPFIAIFRHLRTEGALAGNKLIFANKTRADIILESELKEMLGEAFINILSDEKDGVYASGFIDAGFLRANLSPDDKNFYLCGPPPMMDAVKQHLASLGVGENAITLEL
jgi:ferredoxin-NADP reductase